MMHYYLTRLPFLFSIAFGWFSYTCLALRIGTTGPPAQMNFDHLRADQVLNFDATGLPFQPPETLSQHFRPGPRKRFKTCAIIGSGGDLKFSGLGKDIDAHDLVIRMNHHGTDGYEEDVGAHTHMRFWYPESFANLTEQSDRLHVLVPYKHADWEYADCAVRLENVCSCVNTKAFWKSIDCHPSVNRISTLSKVAWDTQRVHAAEAKLLKHPSMGFTVVIAASMMCEEVSLYGTGVRRVSNGTYCNYDRPISTGCVYTGGSADHDFKGEHAYYNKLVRIRTTLPHGNLIRTLNDHDVFPFGL